MEEATHPWDGDRIRAARARLLAFFDEHRRELPWRETSDPYRIWVSEVMLQQTRVETVVPYYRRWMERFPTVGALAGASSDEVLRHWQGLGYYSRARNLHRAAVTLEREAGGRVPRTVRELRALPGIGAYTAGAVASIAFGVPVPAVDGNVRRVFARLMDAPDPSPAELRAWVGPLVDPERPGDFNQALMELGALRCTPRTPACPDCPLAPCCASRVAGTQAARPAPREARAVPRRAEIVLVLTRADGGGGAEVLLQRRPEAGLLGGMWECPSVEVEGMGTDGSGALDQPPAPPSDPGPLLRRLLHEVDPGGALSHSVDPSRAEPLSPVEHAFTHLRMTYLPFRVRLRQGDVRPGWVVREPLRWVPLEARDAVPLPVAQEAILAPLASVGGP